MQTTKTTKKIIQMVFLYIMLAIVAVIFLIPFYWMICSSVSGADRVR